MHVMCSLESTCKINYHITAQQKPALPSHCARKSQAMGELLLFSFLQVSGLTYIQQLFQIPAYTHTQVKAAIV